MNCQSCGAPMELIESRRYFRCGHCGNYHFPEAVEADGIRIIGHQADGPDCALCKTPMANALLDNDDPIDFCAKCRGILLPGATFACVVDKRRAWANSPPAEPVPLDRRQLQRTLSCPRCAGRFETYAHSGPGNVVIDNCTKCDGSISVRCGKSSMRQEKIAGAARRLPAMTTTSVLARIVYAMTMTMTARVACVAPIRFRS